MYGVIQGLSLGETGTVRLGMNLLKLSAIKSLKIEHFSFKDADQGNNKY